MPRPPRQCSSFLVHHRGHLPPGHLSTCLVLRPVCTQSRAVCKLPLVSGLLCCPLNSHISSLEASKHVLHSYSTYPLDQCTIRQVVLWGSGQPITPHSFGLIAHSACPDAATLCTMRTLQIRETMSGRGYPRRGPGMSPAAGDIPVGGSGIYYSQGYPRVFLGTFPPGRGYPRAVRRRPRLLAALKNNRGTTNWDQGHRPNQLSALTGGSTCHGSSGVQPCAA